MNYKLNLYLNNNEYTYKPLRQVCEIWHGSGPVTRAFKNLYDNDVEAFAEGAATGMQRRIEERIGSLEVDHDTFATLWALKWEILTEINNFEE